MVDFLFDGDARLITEPPGTGDTTFDVDRDIYSAWKRWVQSGAGAQYPAAFQVEGGTPIGATGLVTGTTFILVNGWKLKPAEHDHQAFIIGNLFSDDGVVSVPADTASAGFFVSASVAAQGIESGISGLTAQESADLATVRKAVTNTKLISDDTGSPLGAGFESTLAVLDDDGTTPIIVYDLSENSDETQPYRNQGYNVQRKR